MARFSSLSSLVNTVTAARHGSAIIAAVESRNELGELASWDDFVTTSPLQYLKAELKTPLAIAELKRNMSQYEIGVPLMEGGSLGLKLLPNLCISRVQRDDLDCQEGDKIVSVDGMSVKSIDELRVSLKGKQEVTMIIETGGTPLFTIHDALTPFWEVTSIPLTTTVRGGLKPGDLVLRVNDEPVAGLDTRKALDTAFATIGYLPGESKVAQRIRKEGLMSFATKVRRSPPTLQRATPSLPPALTRLRGGGAGGGGGEGGQRDGAQVQHHAHQVRARDVRRHLRGQHPPRQPPGPPPSPAGPFRSGGCAFECH